MKLSEERLDYYFTIYLRECSAIRSASPHTTRSYKLAYKRFASVGHPHDRQSALDAVMALRDQGVAPSSINAYIRSYSAFLNWLVARGDLSERFPIPRLPVPKTLKPVFESDQAIAVLRCKPTELGERRAQAMFAVALDTALRFGELVSIRRGDIDARNGLISVSGKVGERRVPVSAEGLRWLNRWIGTHSNERVFSTRYGTALNHGNASRDLRALFTTAGVPIELAQWHHIRRYALRSYVASGAGLRGAQLLAGHASQNTTIRYLDADTELRALPHQQISPLARLSGQRR